MGRPRVSAEKVEIVEMVWANNPELKTHQIWMDSKQVMSLRKTQQVVAEAKKKARSIPDDLEIIPWSDDWPTDANEIACLFRLKRKSLQLPIRLTTRVAKWALKIREVFVHRNENPDVDIDFWHLLWAHQYAQEDRVSEIFGQEMNTSYLDNRMMFRVWESQENTEALEAAREQGLISEPDSSTPIVILFMKNIVLGQPKAQAKQQTRPWTRVVLVEGDDSEFLAHLMSESLEDMERSLKEM